MKKRLSLAAVLLVGVAAGTSSVRAAPDAGLPEPGPPDAASDGPEATVRCDPSPGPGRVRCELEARPRAGESIAWGDAVLASVPPFVTALRGRIGPSDAVERTPERWRWAFALVARERGHADLAARIRLVLCRGAACAAREIPVRGRVNVGPES